MTTELLTLKVGHVGESLGLDILDVLCKDKELATVPFRAVIGERLWQRQGECTVVVDVFAPLSTIRGVDILLQHVHLALWGHSLPT